MKLYWKIYLFLAFTTLVTLVLSMWISFSVLPAYFDRRVVEHLVSFEESVMNLSQRTKENIESLADSMEVDIRFVRNSQRPGIMPDPGQGPPPMEDGNWRGVKIINLPEEGFSILTSIRKPFPRMVFLISFALGLFISQAIALALGLKSVFRRTSALTRITGAFGEGNLSARYPASTGNDEIEVMGSAFNTMAERIITLLGSQKELLNSVAHELRTPMARLSFALELARDNPRDANVKLSLMEQDLFELDRLVSELLEFNKIGSSGALTLEKVSMKAICLAAADGERKPDSIVEVTVSFENPDLTVTGDHRLLQRAVSNLIRNSVRYAETKVEVVAEQQGKQITVSVTDDGPGFPQGLTDRAVNPFVKGHDSKGSGLGLSIVNRIAERHNGSLSLSNTKDRGARAVISIPC